MNTVISTVEVLNQFFSSKFPALVFIVIAVLFAYTTMSQLSSLNDRVQHIENVDLAGIRNEIKEVRQDITKLEIRVTRVEVKIDVLTEEVREMRQDIKTLLKRNP